jgi:drug/metabolite transporter (DMT)-like permease
MLNLALTVVLTVTWLVGFRLFKTFKINTFQAVVVNYLTCVSTGILTFGFGNILTANNFALPGVWLALLLGSFFISTFYLTAIGAQKIGLTLTTVATRISLVIPVIFGLWVFQSNQKNFDFLNYLGVLLALMAIVLSSIQKEENAPVARDLSSFFFPLLIFLMTGLVDTTVSFVNLKYVSPQNSAFFSVVSFISAGTIGISILAWRVIQKGEKIAFKNILGGIGIGIPNFFSFYFLILTLADFKNDAAFLYPVFNILTILVSTLVAIMLFREKLSKINWLGIALALIAMLLVAYQEIFINS